MSHPARYSPEVLDVTRGILQARWPEGMGRPIIHDPFAGTGTRLRDLCTPDTDNWGWPYSGTEIEECFIEAASIMHGDSRNPDTYPPARHPNDAGAWGGWVIFTSPVYPNGMADNHLARDSSRRRNYRKAKAELTGNPEAALEDGNMGNLGYRGTKRLEDGGKSKKRLEYWRIARDCVQHWQSAELVLLNVSDFKHSNGQIEPVVDDWCALLHDYGWVNQTVHPVGTQRMRDGANAEQRVDCEVVVVAER